MKIFIGFRNRRSFIVFRLLYGIMINMRIFREKTKISNRLLTTKYVHYHNIIEMAMVLLLLLFYHWIVTINNICHCNTYVVTCHSGIASGVNTYNIILCDGQRISIVVETAVAFLSFCHHHSPLSMAWLHGHYNDRRGVGGGVQDKLHVSAPPAVYGRQIHSHATATASFRPLYYHNLFIFRICGVNTNLLL